MAEEGTPTAEGSTRPPVDPVVEIPEEKKVDVDAEEEDNDAVERMCANFDFPCCGGGAGAVQPDSEPVKEEPKQLEAQEGEGGAHGATGKGHRSEDSSLADIVARMEALDVETADGGESDRDLSRDGGEDAPNDEGNLKALYQQKGVSLSKAAPWYKEPIYASLIAACVVFTIAILVMIILLAKGK